MTKHDPMADIRVQAEMSRPDAKTRSRTRRDRVALSSPGRSRRPALPH